MSQNFLFRLFWDKLFNDLEKQTIFNLSTTIHIVEGYSFDLR